MASSADTHILIIGGGIGGLALAQGLKKNNIACTVFEREQAPDVRGQGYRIKIFPDTVAELQYLLPDDVWTEFETAAATTVNGETVLNALNASTLASRVPRGGPKPYTIDRSLLRKALMKGLDSHIKWGQVFSKYEEDANQVTAHFADGTSATGTLLVGAEGLRSQVRKQHLPSHKILDTGGVCIYGKTPITEELTKVFTPKAMKWMTILRDETPFITEIIMGDTPVTTIVEPMRFPEENRKKRDDLPADYVYYAMVINKKLLAPTDEILTKVLYTPPKALSISLAQEWDPSIRAVLEHQDESSASVIKIQSVHPEIPKWDASARVTLIGDSVHVMSPTGGVGAVTALKDASTLTKEIVKSGVSKESVGAFEEQMRGYAGANLMRSWGAGFKIFNGLPAEKCAVAEV